MHCRVDFESRRMYHMHGLSWLCTFYSHHMHTWHIRITHAHTDVWIFHIRQHLKYETSSYFSLTQSFRLFVYDNLFWILSYNLHRMKTMDFCSYILKRSQTYWLTNWKYWEIWHSIRRQLICLVSVLERV